MSGEVVNARKMAGKLTEAQRRVLVHGLRGRDRITTLDALRRLGLMRAKVADPDPETGGWKATPLGLEVRAILQEQSK